MKGGCFNQFWQGDGYCDDQNNTPECDYDGGDCCGDSNNDFCTECQCLDPTYDPNSPPATTSLEPEPGALSFLLNKVLLKHTFQMIGSRGLKHLVHILNFQAIILKKVLKCKFGILDMTIFKPMDLVIWKVCFNTLGIGKIWQKSTIELF